jgi:protein-tyrosine phosphatase
VAKRTLANGTLGAVVAVSVAVLGSACSSTTSESSPNTQADAGFDSAAERDDDASGGAGGGAVGGAVALDGVVNARHTGGLTTTDGRVVRDFVLIRSGQLTSLSSCAPLEALGIRTVIDLRAASAVATEPDAACVQSTTAYYNADLPKLLPPSEQVYLDTLDATEPKLADIFARLSADQALPAIIHCVIGRDRASLMMALVLLALGVPQDQVLADFENNQAEGTDVDPVWMSGVLARIEQAGGIEAYLAQYGVTVEMLASLRQMALE